MFSIVKTANNIYIKKQKNSILTKLAKNPHHIVVKSGSDTTYCGGVFVFFIEISR